MTEESVLAEDADQARRSSAWLPSREAAWALAAITCRTSATPTLSKSRLRMSLMPCERRESATQESEGD